MPARRIPENASPTASSAERLLADALVEQLPDDAVVMCGRRLIDERQDREADIVVAWPGHGIAVIEVKGGAVSYANGQWRQVGDGFDGRIDPVDQAVTCKHMLQDTLRRSPGWAAGPVRTTHLVALPTTDLPADY